jgi:diguanylate cyclase (GGDEF)-like protein
MRYGFTPHEQRISALPSTITGILILIYIVASGIGIWRNENTNLVLLLEIGAIGTICLIAFNFFFIPSSTLGAVLGLINAIASIIGICMLTYALPDKADIYIGVLFITFIITSALISERRTSYALLFFTVLLTTLIRQDYVTAVSGFAVRIGIAVIAAVIIETIMQLRKSSRDHIHRLEIITDFSRAITSSLETKQVMNLLSAAFQNSIEADAFFVGIREGNELRLELLYDDGEFYENQRIKLDGSLSGWVLDNQQSLFLPDLRKEVHLSHVRLVLAGRHRTSLSWMGVPMRGQNVDGLIAISSYHPNAFDRADLELLVVLSQHAAQAIDNTYQHARVEYQSHIDSLTNVYNHGYFLKLLESHIEAARKERKPLSVIMLDIDHFKQYNDTYGHLAGDEILRNLCNIIKGHLKRTDAVGRWGGEEFVISLPGANGVQAEQVAERVRTSMSKLCILNQEQIAIPVPTVSQGIAVYPTEADKTMKLIDLADQRLYVAKERGRNQIEPEGNHWEKTISD